MQGAASARSSSCRATAKEIMKALASAADALILDLEDAVAPDKRPAAREICCDAARPEATRSSFVRVNAPRNRQTLCSISRRSIRAGPTASCCRSAAAATMCVSRPLLSAASKRAKASRAAACRILPIVTETAASLFGARHIPARQNAASGRDALGRRGSCRRHRSSRDRGTDGRYTPVFDLARYALPLRRRRRRARRPSTPFTRIFATRKDSRPRRESAARDGFRRKAAIHPEQVRRDQRSLHADPEEDIACGKRSSLLRAARATRASSSIDGQDARPPASARQARCLRARAKPRV